MSKRTITKILILGTIGAWLAYDIYAAAAVGNPATESAVIYVWCRQYPQLVLLLGLLVGHFVFRQEGPFVFPEDK